MASLWPRFTEVNEMQLSAPKMVTAGSPMLTLAIAVSNRQPAYHRGELLTLLFVAPSRQKQLRAS